MSLKIASCPLLVGVLVALGSPIWAAGDSAVACHCFRERTYDLAEPAAADPYILATTRSSTLAAVFGADKASLVRIAMKGTAADNLWIAHWAAARIGRDPLRLLDLRRAAGGWKNVFDAGDIVRLGPDFGERLRSGASDASLAAFVVDDVAVSHLRAAPDLVRITRDAGAGSPELILTLILAPRLKLGPPDILALVNSGKSWGAMLADVGIAPTDIDDVVRAIVQAPSTQHWLLK